VGKPVQNEDNAGEKKGDAKAKKAIGNKALSVSILGQDGAGSKR
jgi:hypothetical protein